MNLLIGKEIEMITLYSKQGDKLRQWVAYAEGAEVVVIIEVYGETKE